MACLSVFPRFNNHIPGSPPAAADVGTDLFALTSVRWVRQSNALLDEGRKVLHPFGKTIQPWTFAGIMLSYWCNARCRFCYVSCGPQAREWVDPADAVRWWQELDELARSLGKTVKVHLSGGEPFGNWPVLLETARRAHASGLTGDGAFQKVETNAYWANDAQVVRERVEALDRLGMRKLVVSADPYHQQFVAPERVRTCVEEARRVLGPDRVQVRWLDWYEDMQDVRNTPRPQRNEIFRAALARHRERLTGRAAREMTWLLEATAPSSFADQACDQAILEARHIHIDPYGNVFPGTCAGIILGNARQQALREIWTLTTQKHVANPLLGALIEGGPHVLLRYAKVLGFEPRPAGYAGKCHLCTHVRQFLFETNVLGKRLGPKECYAGPSASGEGEETDK